MQANLVLIFEVVFCFIYIFISYKFGSIVFPKQLPGISGESSRASFPCLDFTAWSPNSGLDFLCLVPFSSVYKPIYKQTDTTGKVKVSSTHRHQRQKKFKCRSTVGNYIAGMSASNDSSAISCNLKKNKTILNSHKWFDNCYFEGSLVLSREF